MRRRGWHRKIYFCFLALLCACAALTLSGCTPTYPKEKLAESVVRVCKTEYKLDVKAEVSGHTLAIYAPIENLWDMTFALTKKAGEELNDIILSVTRVALSTNADIRFYVVIAHDVRIPEIQIIIVKYVDDVKRFMMNDISRGEFSKRMLIDKRINSQAKKEHDVREVFEKMGLDRKWQDAVMNDFFRSPPAALSDIGFWNDKFYIKDISLPEFLAEQIAERIRMQFFEDKSLAEAISVKSARGIYGTSGSRHYFEIDVEAVSRSANGLRPDEVSNTVLRESLKVAAHVIHGYDFKDFSYILIVDEAGGRRVKSAPDVAEKFRKNRVKFDEIASQVEN